jgi:hypothetical protein
MWDEMIDTLLKRDIAATIASDIQSGSLDAMRNFVAAASESPESADLYRSVLSELNFAMHSENALPTNLAEEFTALTAQLAAAIKR